MARISLGWKMRMAKGSFVFYIAGLMVKNEQRLRTNAGILLRQNDELLASDSPHEKGTRGEGFAS